MISVKQVTKVYQQKQASQSAVENVSFEVAAHEIFGIIGESGSGKSTLLRMINTLEKPDKGTILIDNIAVNQLSKQEQRQQRKRIGMIFQQFNLLENLTVYENVALPLKLEKIKEPQRVAEALAFVQLSEKVQAYPKQLSGGEKQRVAIARAIITRPEILLCDEPTSALDGHHAEGIIQLLKRINQEFGTTTVIVSHELSLIQQLCQRTAVLEKGKLLAVFDVKAPEATTAFTSYYQRIKERLQA